jgi:membrane associated rhomboid family serine protease
LPWCSLAGAADLPYVTDLPPHFEQSLTPRREPIFNVPGAVVFTIAGLAAVHALRIWGLSPNEDRQFLLTFAFFPARYDSSLSGLDAWPGGWPGEIWSFVTYAAIHADWTHFALNAVWLLAFGSAVARRFGSIRFLAFFVITAAAGAAAHLLANSGDIVPVVGASAAVSGYMAAALRFVFNAGGPLGAMRGETPGYLRPAQPLLHVLREPRVLAFLGVWFVLNLIFGTVSFSVGEGQSVAWQAHIGGFVAGLLLFPLFDPVRDGTPRHDGSVA